MRTTAGAVSNTIYTHTHNNYVSSLCKMAISHAAQTQPPIDKADEQGKGLAHYHTTTS